MTAPLRQRVRDTPALHERAIQDLSFIRRTMESASSFTDVPGWGLVVIGVTAIGAAVLARAQSSAGRWLSVWVMEAGLSATIGAIMMWLKMRRRASEGRAPVLSVPARKFLFGFWPAIVAGALITLAMIDLNSVWREHSAVPRALPGLWLLLYGVAVTTAGTFSVRAVPIMGAGFMALGAVTLFVPTIKANLLLALGFGLWQIACGLWIARRHGG
jgi:hypothetical protein